MHVYSYLIGICLFVGLGLSACTETPVQPPQQVKTYMLAIINPPDQLPFEFEADEAIGDYKPGSGLLRIQASSIWNGKDKFEFTIKEVKDGIVGEYPIGDFESATANVRAEFFDSQNQWNARSLSGTLKIERFVAAEVENAYWLSGRFSFHADSEGGEVEITSGEIQNAVILQ